EAVERSFFIAQEVEGEKPAFLLIDRHPAERLHLLFETCSAHGAELRPVRKANHLRARLARDAPPRVDDSRCRKGAALAEALKDLPLECSHRFLCRSRARYASRHSA